MTGLERAREDLARGDHRRARERLKSLVAVRPNDQQVRTLLAQAYRADGQPTEAGRWGYLVGPAATDAERAAFEAHCGFGHAQRITERRLRHLLRTRDLVSVADAAGRRRLRQLPTRRPRGHRDGPATAAARLVATWAARLRHRTPSSRSEPQPPERGER